MFRKTLKIHFLKSRFFTFYFRNMFIESFIEISIGFSFERYFYPGIQPYDFVDVDENIFPKS